MKIAMLLMLIGVIVGFSSLPIRRSSKVPVPAAPSNSITAHV
jgi:hypothetical protein